MPNRTPDELRAASKHVYYELWMLLRTADHLVAKRYADEVVNNALIESFAMHTRALSDFLWPNGAHSDDVLASHYFPTGKWTAPGKRDFKEPRLAANANIAHISYLRLDVTPPGKGWAVLGIAETMRSAMNDFYGHVDHGLLSEEWTSPGFPEGVRLPPEGIPVGGAPFSVPTGMSSISGAKTE